MELWKETINKVYLDGDSGWSPTATYAKNGVSVGALAVDAYADGRYGATLPYLLDECTIDVTWSFSVPAAGTITKTDSYEVITPLLTKREIKKILDDPDVTDEEIVEIESAVRYIIQAHTGQSFGKRVKSQIVVGAGDSALSLPARLIDITGLTTLSAVLNPQSVIIIADGWYLKKRWSDAVSALENNNVYWYGDDGYDPEDFPLEAPHGFGHTPERFGHGPVISAPGGRSGTIWKDDYPFTITGTWGYSKVPEPVAEAAKLLLNDYACSEQLYRDRYLESVKAADWRIQFNHQAYLNTGNVRADQLLENYVMKRGWAII
jgi:hypothetical protein